MKHTVKLIVRYLYLGVSLGCMVFVFICLTGYLTGGEAFLEPVLKDFGRQVLGAVITGIACASTSFLYRIERLSMGIKLLIHVVVGMGSFCAVSVYLGWFSFRSKEIEDLLSPFLVFFGLFGILWICFYIYGRQDARKINDRLRELESEDLKQE